MEGSWQKLEHKKTNNEERECMLPRNVQPFLMLMWRNGRTEMKVDEWQVIRHRREVHKHRKM